MGSMGLITRSRNFCLKFVLFVVIITTFVRSSSSANYSTNNVTNIIKSILDGYDIRLRPNFGGAALSIGMDLAIASFDSISEVNMDYTLTLYLHQYWRDERLDFSKQYNNDKDIELTLSGDFADQIWLPDTFFANDKNSFLHEVTEKNKMIRLKSDGSISYGMRFTSTLACMMDLHNYPMDSQNCTVEIESYGYTVSDLLMYWTDSPVTGVVDANLPQFTILGYEATDRNEKLATGTYQRLSLLFSFKRSIGYFIFQTYLPSILIVMLSWVSFWINHQATSARVTLGIMTVLTMTTISTGVRSSLPRISYVKAIDIYLVVSFVFVFAALLEYSLINYTYWGERAKKKVRTSRDNHDRNDRHRRHYRERLNNSLNYAPPEPLIEYKDAATSPIHHLASRQSTVWPNSSRISTGKRYYNPHENIHNPYLTGLTNDSTIRHRINNPQPINVFYPISQPNYNRQINSMPFPSEAYDYKRKASKVKIHKIKDVNKIDRYSRILFPVSYMTFNALYWTFYRLY